MRDPNKLAEEILDLLDDMIEVVELENEMLETSTIDLFEPLVQKKISLFDRYTKKLDYLRRFSEIREGIDGELREELLEANEEFQAIAEKNQKLLEIAVEAGQQLFASLSDAATETQNHHLSRYDRDGAKDSGGAKPVALAYDQEL